VIDKVAGEGASVKPVGEVTLSVRLVAAVVLPDVPVTVTVNAPSVAALLAVSVSTLEVAEDAGLNEAVTPLGRPDAVNDTVPVNPLRSVTVMVSVPLLPCFTERLVAEGASVKPVPGTMTVMVVDRVIVPLVPTI
jgi:hypothetical protein